MDQPDAAASAIPPRPSSIRRIAPYAVLVLGGGAMAGSWLDQRFFPGAWIGMFVLVYLTSGRPAHVAFRRGMVFGLVAIISAFHWVPEVTSTQLAIWYPTATILFVLAAACDAFHFALAVWLVARLAGSRIWSSLLFPVCFIGLEFVWIRTFPWRLAHSQIAWTSFIQIAEFVGVYGVGFVMAWTITVGALWLKRFLESQSSRHTPCAAAADGTRSVPATLGEVALCASVLIASLVFGVWRIADIEGKVQSQPPLRVGLVQADVWQENAHAKIQQMSAIDQELDLICWPESSVGKYSLDLTDFRSAEQLRERSRIDPPQETPQRPWENPRCALLCVGKSFSTQTPKQGPYFVTAFLLDSEENITARYHKRTLLPLGEYVPGDRWFPQLAKFALLEESISPGTSPGILDLPGRARIGTLICYEDMVDSNARASAAAGAEVLVALINGASFGETPAMRQHQQLAYFRALENRRYFLRCSTTGSTSVISPTGKLVAQLPEHQDATLLATVHPLSVTTLYTRIGNVAGYLCLAAIGGLMIVRWRAWRRDASQETKTAATLSAAEGPAVA